MNIEQKAREYAEENFAGVIAPDAARIAFKDGYKAALDSMEEWAKDERHKMCLLDDEDIARVLAYIEEMRK